MSRVMPMLDNHDALVLRSVLFAPATRADVLAKLPRSQPDAAIIDLEDGVPFEAKEAARGVARAAIENLTVSHPQVRWFMRLNAIDTPWFADDVAQALIPTLTGVVLPKYESLEQFEQLRSLLIRQHMEHLIVMVGIETARGVEQVRQSLHAPIGVAYFGAEDFIADMGGQRTEEGLEVLYARSRVVLAARIAGIPALDQVVTDFYNNQRFSTEAEQARALGYTGKLCIHPAQVPLAKQHFSPSPHEIDHAQRLLDAYQQAQAVHQGVIVFEGQMVDLPMVRRAQTILAQRTTLAGKDDV
jgi:citrate lyase subunit beta/citryl-CoA lyase